VDSGLVLGDWFFLPPRHSLLVREPVDQINAAIFVGVSLAVLFFSALTRRAATRELAARDRIAGILECTGDGVCTVDGEWRVTYFKPQLAHLGGVEPAQVLGRSYWVMEQRKTVHFEASYASQDQWL